jgi:hypothetical protein
MAALWRGATSHRIIFSCARHARRPRRCAGARGSGSAGVVRSAGRTFARLGRHTLGAQAIRPPPSPARPHPPRRWSMRGPRNLGTTTTARTDVAACAGTTPKSSGATPKKWDARWREAKDARCGFATTIRQATGSASGPIRTGFLTRDGCRGKAARVPVGAK